jgi:two-component system sensor histidine kinase GlrK
LSGWLILGLAPLTLVFLGGVLWAAAQLKTLMLAEEATAQRGTLIARGGEDLLRQLPSLERAVRVYALLGRRSILDRYRREDASLSATLEQLEEGASPELRQTLLEIGRQQENIRARVLTFPAGAPIDPGSELLARFAELAELSNRVVQLKHTEIDRELAQLESQTRQARRQLYWNAALLPLLAGAILWLTVLVSRPLRTLDQAITKLGEGGFLHPVSVQGGVPSREVMRLQSRLEWLRQRHLEVAREGNLALRTHVSELKIPVSQIVEGPKLLMDEETVGKLDPNQREVVQIMVDNGMTAERIPESLVAFLAWQSCRTGFEPSEFPLLKLVKDVTETQQSALLAKHIRLELHIEDLSLVADAGQIRLIIETLLSNAIRRSPRSATLRLRARKADTQLVLDISDEGPGIPVKERPHLFEPFFTLLRGLPGADIGLSLVREFVSTHRGRVEIVDSEHEGAHFRVTLPLSVADPSVQAAHSRGPAVPLPLPVP